MTLPSAPRTYITTYDPAITGFWQRDASGELEPPPLELAHQWTQLECLNDHWMDLEAARPFTLRGDRRRDAGQALQAAHRWMRAHPDHPGLAALLSALDEDPLFLMLGTRVLWHDAQRNELCIPGLGGGLTLDEYHSAGPAGPHEGLPVAGLLGVTYDDRVDALQGARVVVWPWPVAEVARVTGASRPRRVSGAVRSHV